MTRAIRCSRGPAPGSSRGGRVAAQAAYGLDPGTGRILWSHPHDTSGDMNNSTPIWGPDNVLLISSGYNQGTRALRLTRHADGKAIVIDEDGDPALVRLSPMEAMA